MSSSLQRLPIDTKGSIYFTISANHEGLKADFLENIKAKNIGKVILVDNHQSYEQNLVTEKKSFYRASQVNASSYIVIDNCPTEELKDDYEFHGHRNLVKLTNYIYWQVQKGENILIDVNQKSECTNLIYMSLVKSALYYSHHEAIELMPENKDAFSKIHVEMLEKMDPSFVPPALPDHIEIPLGLKGNVYRGVMPRHVLYDDCASLKKLKDSNIGTIVCLNESDEFEVGTSTDLITVYKESGFNVIHFPIKDRTAPELEQLRAFTNQLKEMVEEGNNLVIHCWGGNGRTGTILASMAKVIQKIEGTQAVEFVRQYVPKAVETKEQEEAISKL